MVTKAGRRAIALPVQTSDQHNASKGSYKTTGEVDFTLEIKAKVSFTVKDIDGTIKRGRSPYGMH